MALTDLVLPEGFSADEPLQKEFVELMNKGLTGKEFANELIKLQAKAVTTASERGSQEFQTLQTQWQDEIKADPEFGGPKLQANLANIGKLLDRFGTPEARQAFDITGAGNNPAVFRMMSKIAAALGEGTSFTGNPGGQPRTHAETLYPNQGKQ